MIINVHLTGILKASGKNNLIEYTPHGNGKTSRIPLRNVAWAELLNSYLMQKAA